MKEFTDFKLKTNQIQQKTTKICHLLIFKCKLELLSFLKINIDIFSKTSLVKKRLSVF